MVRRTLATAMIVALALLLGGAGSVAVRQNSPIAVRPAVAPPDTFKIWSHSTAFPNASARALTVSGFGRLIFTGSDTTKYTKINSADDGTAVKYATIQRGAPNTVYSAAANAGFNRLYSLSRGDLTEDTFSWDASQRLCYVWVSTEGFTDGQKVESAFFYINAGTGGADMATSPSYFTVRADTIDGDYAMLTGTAVGASFGTANDMNMFAASWNEADTEANTPFIPSLDSRDDVLDGVASMDWHDIGPRSATTYGNVNYAAGYCFAFDVKDALQQVIDNGDIERGVIFVLQLYGGTVAPTFSAGNHPVVGATSKGLPGLVATTSSRRGPEAWDGVRVPVVLTFDDNKSDHTLYMPLVRAAGLRFCNINQTEAFDVSPNARYDSLMAANAGFVDVVHHSKTHPAFGELTGTQLHVELDKGDQYAGWTAPPDTAAITGFAHPGGTPRRYSFEGIAAIMRHGYQSARGSIRKSGIGADATPIGWVDYLAWDRPSNPYAIAVYGMSNIVCTTGTTTRTSKASVREAFYDALDAMYTMDRSAFVFYAHSRFMDGLTPTALQWLIEVVQQSNCLGFFDYYDLIELRMNGSDFMTPSAAADWFDDNGYNQSIYSANVARWDTLGVFDGSYPNRVWLEAK